MATRTSVHGVQKNRAGARAASATRHRRKRHGKRVLHYILLLLFLVAAGAVLSFTVLFKVEGVEVLGADRYTPDEIAAASGVELEENLLRVDKSAIEETLLEQFPYIHTVEVRLKLPPRVQITVTQEEVAGAISGKDGEIVLINNEGKVLERGVLLIPDGVPVVKGIETDSVQPGEMLGDYTPPKLPTGTEMPEEELAKQQRANEIRERLVMFRYFLDAMESSGFTNLTNLDLTDRLNMQSTFENRIVLKLGSESQLDYKLYFLKDVLENNLGPDDIGVLDATEIYRNRIVYNPSPADNGKGQVILTDAVLQGDQPEEPEPAEAA